MNNSIQKYLQLLNDNELIAKYRSVPDYIDNRDEILAELHEHVEDVSRPEIHEHIEDDLLHEIHVHLEEGLPPDSFRYFEVNGFSNSSKLNEYLNDSFDQFRTEFHAGRHVDNKGFIQEIETKIKTINENIVQAIYEVAQIKDDELIKLFNVKANICDESLTFINDIKEHSKKPHANSIQENNEKPKIKKERLSYKWLKSSEELENLFSEMIKKELIAKNTQWDDFKIIFSNLPISSIKKPVHWVKKANLFAYFFRKLINNRFIPQKPSWILLKHCFTYYREDIGAVVPIHEGVKSHTTDFKEYAPKHFELIDSLFPSAKDPK